MFLNDLDFDISCVIKRIYQNFILNWSTNEKTVNKKRKAVNAKGKIEARRFFIICLVLSSVIGSAFFVKSVYADIYRYIDENGVLHFTNMPMSSDYELYLREGSIEQTPDLSGSYLRDRYEHVIAEASQRHGVSASLLKAIIKVESNFNPWAVSRKGTKGLMQIMPDNFQALSIKDPFDPEENIMGGTRYFKQLLTQFNGKLTLALAAYNAGPERVNRYKRIPPIEETENYVEKVMKYYYLFKKG